MRWRTIVRLCLAGWYPSRDVGGDIGVGLNETAANVLREFGGLCVSCNGGGRLVFESTASNDLQTTIQSFSEKTHTKLSPIGELQGSDDLAIVVSDRGTVYAIIGENELRGIGASVMESLDCLIGGVRRSDVIAQKKMGFHKLDRLN